MLYLDLTSTNESTRKEHQVEKGNFQNVEALKQLCLTEQERRSTSATEPSKVVFMENRVKGG